jgi:hypothetical protein
MWPLAGASFLVTLAAISPHDLRPNDIPQPDILATNP